MLPSRAYLQKENFRLRIWAFELNSSSRQVWMMKKQVSCKYAFFVGSFAKIRFYEGGGLFGGVGLLEDLRLLVTISKGQRKPLPNHTDDCITLSQLSIQHRDINWGWVALGPGTIVTPTRIVGIVIVGIIWILGSKRKRSLCVAFDCTPTSYFMSFHLIWDEFDFFSVCKLRLLRGTGKAVLLLSGAPQVSHPFFE